MKLQGFFTTGFFVLLAALAVAVQWGGSQRTGRRRAEANQEALFEREREYFVRDSLSALSIGTLTLKANEFGRYFAEINSMVRDMGLRLKRLESISQSALKSNYEISAPVRDTIVAIDTTQLARGYSIVYKDPWIELDGTIVNDFFKGSVVTYDTLTQVVHRVPRRFLFFRFGTKELRQEIVSSNPHTRLTYSRYIRIER